MNGKIKAALTLAGLSILFFGIIADTWFSYTMILMKIIFFISGVICIGGCLDLIHSYFKVYNHKNKETVYNLIFRSGYKSRVVNILTIYRIAITPVLLILVWDHSPAFKWILLSAFVTDILDGFLARYWKVTSKLGAKLDSLADDFLFVVSLIAVIYLHTDIIVDNILIISAIIFIFLIKMILLWFRHDKIISGMHTYLTKTAAFLQAIFFIHSIFFQPSNTLFYITVITTIIAIVEEIIIIYSFKVLKENCKGLFFNRSQL